MKLLRRGALRFPAIVSRRLLTGSCLAGLVIVAQPATAQGDGQGESQASAPQADERGLGDIVVSARYFAENLQDTPIAITAQTNEQLKAANVVSVGTLGAVVPNLWTVPGDSQSAGTPLITMRGVLQGTSSSLAVPPAVAIYTDDVYHASTAGSDLDFTDIDRLEVNRGPQSTLAGNASIGGSIKLYTVDPRGDGSGYLTVVGGSRKKMGISGAFDLGLSPTLALRVSGNVERQEGFVDRLDFTCEMRRQGTPELAGTLPLFRPSLADASGQDGCVIGKLGGGTKAVGQAKLRWRPVDAIDLILTVRHREEDMEETPEIALSYQPNPNPNITNTFVEGWNVLTRPAFGIQLDSRFMAPEWTGGYATYATNCRPRLAFNPSGFCYDQGKTAAHTLVSGKLVAELSDKVRMTAIGAYTNYNNEFTQNGDQSPLGYVVSHFENRNRQWSGEVRFDGSLLDERLNWVLGSYLLRMKGVQDNFVGVITLTQNSLVEGRNSSQSGFFHLGFNLTDKWRISGGTRYTDSEILITIDNPAAVSVLDPVSSTQKRWDWLLSTDYKITDDLMVFASAASGSRPAGLTTILQTARQLGPTPAEELISYEVGLKADFFGSRLRTNLNAFYVDYKTVSAAVQGFECLGEPGPTATWFATRASCQQFAPNTGQVNYTVSVGIPATVKGFEWEITALPVDGLRFDWTGGYNRYVSSVKTAGQPGHLFPGNRRQPAWNMHASASYDVETSLGVFTPRVAWNWQSKQTFDPSSQLRAPLPFYTIKAYGLWNAQISYEAPGGDWTAVLQVANVADRFHHYQMFQGSLNTQTRLGAPREVSLTVRRNF